MVMGDQTRMCQAAENREYVRRLLRERQPEFQAQLEDAVRQLDLELSRERSGGKAFSSRLAAAMTGTPILCDLRVSQRTGRSA